MVLLLICWIALLAALLVWAIGRPGEGGALTLSYFLGLSLIHVPGVLPLLDPLAPVVGRDATQIGFELTLMGMAAFVIGAVVARQVHRSRVATAGHPEQPQTRGLAWGFIAAGTVSYFVLLPIVGNIPSLTSIIASLAALLITGLWLRIYGTVHARDTVGTVSTLAVLPLLPLATLATGGFLGFGIYWVLSVMSFFFTIVRQRLWFFLPAPLVGFLALSLFVTYMGERTGIRDVVWREHAALTDRLQRISTIVTDFQVLDLGREQHVRALNDRLNQNYFVGVAVQRHQSGAVDLAYGGTVSPLALIPRAIWSDKPAVGGGGDLVTRFTGIPLSPGSSFGAGQVLEFYMNFGLPGVLGGFFIVGLILMWLDRGIIHALAVGDTRAFVTRAMTGLPLLQPGGNLLEILVAAAAGLITANVIFSFLLLRRSAPGDRGQSGVSGTPRSSPAEYS